MTKVMSFFAALVYFEVSVSTSGIDVVKPGNFSIQLHTKFSGEEEKEESLTSMEHYFFDTFAL